MEELSLYIARHEVFTAVKIQVQFFWVVTPCSVVEAASASETFVSYLTRYHNPEDGGSMDL
jgi:hypothetical protein